MWKGVRPPPQQARDEWYFWISPVCMCMHTVTSLPTPPPFHTLANNIQQNLFLHCYWYKCSECCGRDNPWVRLELYAFVCGCSQTVNGWSWAAHVCIPRTYTVHGSTCTLPWVLEINYLPCRVYKTARIGRYIIEFNWSNNSDPHQHSEPISEETWRSQDFSHSCF